jgi:hypothetical protein
VYMIIIITADNTVDYFDNGDANWKGFYHEKSLSNKH